MSPLTTSVSYRQRVKLLRIDLAGDDAAYGPLLRDSFDRLLAAGSREQFAASFAYGELVAAAAGGEAGLLRFLDEVLLPLYDAAANAGVALGLKRVLYHAHRDGALPPGAGLDRLRVAVQRGRTRRDQVLEQALAQLRSRTVVFVTAEAEPFSKSGGLANVTCELPRELAVLGERLCVITPLYRSGEAHAVSKMEAAIERFGVTWTGVNVQLPDRRRTLRDRRPRRGGRRRDLLPARPPRAVRRAVLGLPLQRTHPPPHRTGACRRRGDRQLSAPPPGGGDQRCRGCPDQRHRARRSLLRRQSRLRPHQLRAHHPQWRLAVLRLLRPLRGWRRSVRPVQPAGTPSDAVHRPARRAAVQPDGRRNPLCRPGVHRESLLRRGRSSSTATDWNRCCTT